MSANLVYKFTQNAGQPNADNSTRINETSLVHLLNASGPNYGSCQGQNMQISDANIASNGAQGDPKNVCADDSKKDLH